MIEFLLEKKSPGDRLQQRAHETKLKSSYIRVQVLYFLFFTVYSTIKKCEINLWSFLWEKKIYDISRQRLNKRKRWLIMIEI